MKTKYTREQLMKFSNEELLEKTIGRAVDIYLSDGHWTQLCVNDLMHYESQTGHFYTKTGIEICLQEIDYIEVFEKTR